MSIETKAQIKQRIITSIQDYCDKEYINYRYYNLFKEALAPFEGKKITKRMMSAVEKAIGDDSFQFFWDADSSWWAIKFRGKHHMDPYYRENWMSFNLGYRSSGDFYSEAKFIEQNRCYGSAAMDRIELSKEAMKNPKTLELLVEKVLVVNRLKELDGMSEIGSYYFPASYQYERDLKINRGQR